MSLVNFHIIEPSALFLKKMFRVTFSLTQENHHFIVQIRKINAINGQNYPEHALPHITQLTVTDWHEVEFTN
jgi:hypothetical protein